MVKIAPATRASPTDAAVRAMFCSRIVPRIAGMRNSAIAITAAGIVAATVCPARIPRYAFAEPKTNARKIPSATAFTVISGGPGCWSGRRFRPPLVAVSGTKASYQALFALTGIVRRIREFFGSIHHRLPRIRRQRVGCVQVQLHLAAPVRIHIGEPALNPLHRFTRFRRSHNVQLPVVQRKLNQVRVLLFHVPHRALVLLPQLFDSRVRGDHLAAPGMKIRYRAELLLRSASACAFTTASAATPAVSARRIVGPSDTAIHPASSHPERSRAVHPPSGPSRIATLPALEPSAVISGRDPSSSNTIFIPASPRGSSANRTGAAIAGSVARRDCSLASRAIRRHLSTRFPAAISSPFSLRSAITGTIDSTPSSVAFSISHSKRSNFMSAAKSVV